MTIHNLEGDTMTTKELLDSALSELGVPSEDYAAPVANAVELISQARDQLEADEAA